MADYLYKTRGNSSPHNKPRIYFTCHPDDFECYFDKICEDIFKTQDCAIYYTEDMNERIPDEDKLTVLGSMNLFVIPVTFRLLTTPNRAMDDDFVYARKEHIPILPIMMEYGIDVVYSRQDKFGELQYINPGSSDITEINYEEKLKKYLEFVLIGEETAKRIRAAFDAYIFLSYRKKDRRYANELMRLIHSKQEFRDIAIWYDEFLTIGESFKDNIDKMLKNSELFTLLVTPNLLEEPNGKPNFVMEHEYPNARDAGMDILPAEMEKTDKYLLREKYLGIPECINPREDKAFNEQLLTTISKIAVTENDDEEDPEHTFLIGLAYLDGVDVEVNRELGVELVTKAAQSEYPEAMEKLWQMYYEGEYIELDYHKAVVWAEKLATYYLQTKGKKDINTLMYQNNLALTYGELGEYKKSLELNEIIYALYCEVLGDNHPNTLASLSNLAGSYSHLGYHKKVIELLEKIFVKECEVPCENNPDILSFIPPLAISYCELGDYRKAINLLEKEYTRRCKIFGEKHSETLNILHNLASTWGRYGNRRRALRLQKKVYSQNCEVFGENHPITLKTLNNLALSYGVLGDYSQAIDLLEKVYAQQCEVLGEKHPDTLASLYNLSYTYDNMGNYQKAIEMNKKVCPQLQEVLGDKHPDTLTALHMLAVLYGKLGKHKEAHELLEEVYSDSCEAIGKKSPSSLTALHDLAFATYELGDYRKARELQKKAYAQRCEVLGEKNADTLISLSNLAYLNSVLGEHNKALELHEKVYIQRCEVFGKDHPSTLKSLYDLAINYEIVGNYNKSKELMLKYISLKNKNTI